MMTEWLEGVADDDKVSIKKIGLSLGGLDIFSLIINDRRHKREAQSEEG